jgi:hypothetical protein
VATQFGTLTRRQLAGKDDCDPSKIDRYANLIAELVKNGADLHVVFENREKRWYCDPFLLLLQGAYGHIEYDWTPESLSTAVWQRGTMIIEGEESLSNT